jgi:hypothetical protein
MLIPSWIPKENWNDLLAMSLIPGELEQFISKYLLFISFLLFLIYFF